MTDVIAVDRMAARLTVPFQRGADRLALTLLPVPGTPGLATVAPYDFAEHRAGFDTVPDPRYVVTALRDVPAAATLTIGYTNAAGAERTATAAIPAGTLAGMSVPLDLGADEGPGVRLKSLAMTPPPSGEPGTAARWDVRALLGVMSRLLWVVGGARDELRAHATRARRLTRLSEASGPTLDLIGADLAVPRFPPLPYTFEEGTIALYHLEDASQSGGPIADAMTLYDGIANPGTVTAARTGATGRFGRGVAFEVPAAEIAVPHHAKLVLDATNNFTAECFVRPADGTWEGAVLSKHANPANTALAGWMLSIGTFGRGIPRNVRFLVGDGTAARTVLLFADQPLPTGRFSHLAGVIDRAAGQARLFVDGVLRATRPLGQLGAPNNTVPVRIGRASSSAATTFQGVVDEVRLSRAARTGFSPLLGESDNGYRRRLGIFQRWRLPTPTGLQQALNDTVGEIHGIANPLVVEDTDATLAGGEVTRTIRPRALAVGESIDDLGRRGTTEAEVSGTPGEDFGFDPDLLVDAGDPRVTFLILNTDMVPPNRMRVGTRRALRALLDRIEAADVPGRLLVVLGFPPTPLLPSTFTDLHAVGRKLAFIHPSIPSQQLALMAHNAGFTRVELVRDGDQTPVVIASVRSTEGVEIELANGGTATPENGFDLLTGQTLSVRVAPELPLRAQVRWLTIECGAGRAEFTGRTDQAAAVLTATRPGDMIAEVQVTLGSRSFRAIRRFRVGIGALNAGESISGTGLRGAPPSIAGGPREDFFEPAYLITVDDERVAFGPATNDRRMTSTMAARLGRLLDLIPAPQPPNLNRPLVSSAWKPAGTGLETEGRALTLERGSLTITLERLGALAHAAGFTHVTNDGTRLRVLQAAGDPLEIGGPDFSSEGSTVELRVELEAIPTAAAQFGSVLYVTSATTDMVSAIDTATGRVVWATKTDRFPAALAVDQNGSRLFVSCTDDGESGDRHTINVIRADTGVVTGTVDVGARAVDLACHPTQAWLFAGLDDGRVIKINANSLAILNTLTLTPAVPIAIAVQPNGTRLWVAAGDSTVRVIDTATNNFAVVATVQLAGRPADIALNANRAYVTIREPTPAPPPAPPPRATMQVLTVPTPAVQAAFTDIGPVPGRLALSPNGQSLYVTDLLEQRIYIRRADGAPHATRATTTPIDGSPRAVTADDRRAYLVSSGEEGGRVAVIDAERSAAPVDNWPLGSGHGERLIWTLQTAGDARARLTSTTRFDVGLIGESAGPVRIQAAYEWPDHPPSHTFQVRLAPALEALESAGTPVVIRKDQYDLIMNVLNELHPIGVEVDTSVVRAHVVEVRTSLTEVFPGHTFPDFRTRGPRPPIPPIGQDP